MRSRDTHNRSRDPDAAVVPVPSAALHVRFGQIYVVFSHSVATKNADFEQLILLRRVFSPKYRYYIVLDFITKGTVSF